MKNDELHPHIRIRSPLRCDGIGHLDCAEDTESGARLAVRWLPLDANGESAVRACAKLPEHPTLPRVRQTGVAGDKAFLAMEFPDGKLLSTMVGETVSGELLLEMGAQLADALATIHSQQVFHGELSAESVLLAKGKAYLWDMPLVIANRLTDRRGEERLMHQLVRTAPFLPPERAKGGQPTPEGDVYALAAVMCLAGGAKAAEQGTTLAIVHSIVTGQWAPTVPAVFHAPYRGLLERMLSREPSQRPTAREVADLLGRPAGAIPTIPEMPAIVVPPGHALPRHMPKTPYHAAPGSLEPALPPKAVADAAVKAAVGLNKPLPVTVPHQFEPTVKVNVPVSVLAAMSTPSKSTAELVDVLEHHKPVVPSATIPTTKTLEFGLQLPAEAVPPLVMPAGAAVKEKTPPPSQAPQVAQVEAALEALAAPTTEPTAPTAPTAPELPPLAPREAGATEPVLPPVVETLVPRSVTLQENVKVSPETFAAGAAVLSDEEAEELERAPRQKPVFALAAVVLSIITIAFAVAARQVAHKSPAAPAVSALPVLKPAPKAEPVKAVPFDDDELAPLPAVPKAPKPAAKPAAPTHKPAAPQTPSRLEGKYDSHGDAPPPPADDFSFLDSSAEAPKEELKRPAF